MPTIRGNDDSQCLDLFRFMDMHVIGLLTLNRVVFGLLLNGHIFRYVYC